MPRSAAISGRVKQTAAFVGNPNTGKSTLFNALTGHRQRVGNYPGVTVDKRTGSMRELDGGVSVTLVDLPGAYSLAAHSQDEAVVLDVLLGHQDVERPDLIVVVVDASNLARNLFFTTQLMELGRPVVIALNMIDVAEASGVRIDADALARALGVPVVPVVATREQGIDALRRAVFESAHGPAPAPLVTFPASVAAEVDGLVHGVAERIGTDRWRLLPVEALQILLDPGGYGEQRLIDRCGAGLTSELAERRGRIEAAGESIIEVEARIRYAWIDPVVACVTTRVAPTRRSRSDAADRVLTHRVFGLAILLGMMALGFQAVYAWAGPLVDAVDASFAALGAVIAETLPVGALHSLLENGVVAGVGAVLAFLPQILILFLFIAVLEDCGYMARAAFLLDRWMGYLGLSGKSFIPLLSCFACAVPGIMATRTIEDRRDRFVTILLAPLMSCSARLPVYVLMIGAFVPARRLLGGLIGLQAATLGAMYLVGIVVAIPVGLVLRRTVLCGGTTPFLMELPAYRWPSVRTVLYRVFERGRQFCVTAGTIIIAVTVIVWALGYYPHPARIAADHEAQRAAAREAHAAEVVRCGERYNPGMTAAALATHGPIVAVLEAIEATAQRFLESDMGGGTQGERGGANDVRLRLDVEVARVVSDAGPAGEAALAWDQANRAVEQRLMAIDRSESGAYLRQSMLGRVGHWVEPVVRPLGWDWRIGTAAIASFPARELIVAALSTIHNLGDRPNEAAGGLRRKLREATWPDGRPVFNLPVALSVMVFVALGCQCGATLATIKRETKSWRWPLLTFSYMTVLAYVAALVTYQVAIRLV